MKNKMTMNIGTSSLIVVFAVASLVTFAVLSLSASGAAQRQAEKMAERTTEYYQAENQALELLWKLEAELDEAAESGSEEEFLQKALALTKSHAAEAPEEWNLCLENNKICWQVPVSENQQIEMELTLQYPKKQGENAWEVTKRQVVRINNAGTKETETHLYGAETEEPENS